MELVEVGGRAGGGGLTVEEGTVGVGGRAGRGWRSLLNHC